MAGITRDEMMGIFHGVFGAHGENLRPIMKVKEFYGRDDEDPHEWCAEFEKACAANGWSGNDNNIRRKDIASSYLRGNAAEWYETDQANIVQWHIDGQNDNFRERFKNYFSPQSKQIKWQTELISIQQEIGESIEDYAKRFKKIMRKVNYINALADGVQINYFIKGLNPVYTTHVLASLPANLNAAINQAKLLETGSQIAGLTIQGNVNQRTENNEQIRRNTFTREKDMERNKVDELTEMMKRMEIKVANIGRGKISGNRNNNDTECFKCGKIGHIAKNCRTQIQRNLRQNTRNDICNNCGKIGHTERECYRNQTCQRCGRQGHTQQICRSTISALNYTDYDNQNNDDEFYEYYNEGNDRYDDEDEVYVTLRSGTNTNRRRRQTPEFAKRLQNQNQEHQRQQPVVIQQGQIIQEENTPPKTRRMREPSRMERSESYDIIKDLMETQAHATFAQILQDSKQMKKLKDAIRGKNHVEIADEQ